MKKIRFISATVFLFILFLGCDKDKNFCIQNISAKKTAAIGEVSFTLPNGEKYSGFGGKPFPETFGKYTGIFQSVVTKQEGMNVELVHYFDDGKGNAFWTSDRATFTPLDNTMTLFMVDDVMTIVDGTGDFKCASGKLINKGPINFVTNTLEVNMTGNVCGGCK